MNKENKTAYDNIKKYCDNRLKEKYPAGIPSAVQERYSTELKALKDSGSARDFEIFMNLSIEARKASQLMFLRGLSSGSFLVYLVNDMHVNPLPAHYYCDECGYYEEVASDLYGIDLPGCDCPKCGKKLYGDGMNLQSIHVWGSQMNTRFYFESNTTYDFYPFAKRVLQKMYPENNIEVFGMSWMGEGDRIALVHGGFVILPDDKTIDDYPELITYLDDGTRCIACSVLDVENYHFKRIHMYSLWWLDMMMYMQNKTGIYCNEIGTADIKGITYRDVCNTKLLNDTFVDIVGNDRPRTFRKLSDISASIHNTYYYGDKEDNGYSDRWKFNELIHSEAFEKYPMYTREDVYDHLIKLGYDEQTAYEYMTAVRKGKLNKIVYGNSERWKKQLEKLLELELPDELKDMAAKVQYLFPRAHGVNYMHLYYLLAYYMRQDARTYNYYVKKMKR